MWNYYPQAASLSAQINLHHYETCEIEKGDNGQFEIFKNDKSILSKKDHGDFFTIEDVKKKLEELGQSFYGEWKNKWYWKKQEKNLRRSYVKVIQ